MVKRECKRQQSIACSEGYRLLLPINRLTPCYHAVRKSRGYCERTFRYWRTRYGVAGKNADTRLKRPGLPFQQLRAPGGGFAMHVQRLGACLSPEK